jgi:hypothetical protein
MNITVCPPAPQFTHFDIHQFDCKPSLPVEAHYVGGQNGVNGWESTGVDFDSYARMQTSRRKINKGRRFLTPAWTANDHDVQAVIVGWLESRAFSKKQLRMCSRPSLKTRLYRAEEAIRSQMARQEQTLDRLCAEYVQSTDPARRRLLESEVQGLDAQIRINRDPAKVVAGVIHLYYRQGLTSVEVASELGFKSPWVRQLLYRIAKIATDLGFEPTESITCQRRDFADERSKRIAEKQAAKEARRAEKIAAREEREAREKAERIARSIAKENASRERRTRAERRAERERRMAELNARCPGKRPGEKLYDYRRRVGVCVDCGEPPREGIIRCEKCAARQRTYFERSVAKKQAAAGTAPVAA